MNIFSLGFILLFIISSWLSNIDLKIIKDFFESMITILASILLLIFICWQIVNSINKKLKYKKRFCLLNDNWQCLLIDGVWGSGKTTHYETYYKYIDAKPNIYISCFSASRSELIAQIIQQQFCYNLLTLNGLLAKLMESNWQIFMPKGRVIVFDDLERLHTNEDNYLDLIGIIDYLKITNECKIILIADISKTQQIFNTYMERVVDEFLIIPKLQLMDLFSLEYNDKKYHNICTSIIEPKSPIITEVLNQCQQLHDNGQLNNLRIFKNEFLKLVIEVLNIQEKEKWDENRQIIYAKFLGEKFQDFILKRYIFFIDNVLFNSLCSSAVSSKAESLPQSLLNKEQKPSESDILKARKLNKRLHKYTNGLNASSFNHKDSELSNKKLDINTVDVKLIEFVLYKPEEFIGININFYGAPENRLLDILKNNQETISEWKIYLRGDFIPTTIEKFKNSKYKTWIPGYYSYDTSGTRRVYLSHNFSSYYRMAIILTQIGVDNLLINEVIDTMVRCEKYNITTFGEANKNFIIDESINRSIKRFFWDDDFCYSLVWFLDYDVEYERDTIKDQINQKIDEIFNNIRNKIKQKLNNGTH